jgi:SAM-dependent methyltransferase
MAQNGSRAREDEERAGRMSTDTAHATWDATWKTSEGRTAWSRPEPDLVAFAATARLAGASRALDLGCGVGRHTLALALLGFVVDAVDASPAGLQITRDAVKGMPVTTHEAMMTRLPFESASFDLVVSWNVIYHGAPDVVQATIAEMARVSKPGARVIVTMLTKRNSNFGIGEEVAPDTWVNPAATDDKVHPHFFCDAEGFGALFRDFHVMTLREDSLGRPGHSHWVGTLERKA